VFIFKYASDSSYSLQCFKHLLCYSCAVPYLWLRNLYLMCSNWQYINIASFLHESYSKTLLFQTYSFNSVDCTSKADVDMFILLRFYLFPTSTKLKSLLSTCFLNSLCHSHLQRATSTSTDSWENATPLYLAHSASDLNCMLFRSIGFTVLNPQLFLIPNRILWHNADVCGQRQFLLRIFGKKNSQPNKNISYFLVSIFSS